MAASDFMFAYVNSSGERSSQFSTGSGTYTAVAAFARGSCCAGSSAVFHDGSLRPMRRLRPTGKAVINTVGIWPQYR